MRLRSHHTAVFKYERLVDQCDPLQLSITRYNKEIRDINASGEVLLSDAKLEAEAEAHVQADIAEQVDIVKQVSHPLHVLPSRSKGILYSLCRLNAGPCHP